MMTKIGTERPSLGLTVKQKINTEVKVSRQHQCALQSCTNLYLHEAIIVSNEVVLFHKMH